MLRTHGIGTLMPPWITRMVVASGAVQLIRAAVGQETAAAMRKQLPPVVS